MKPDFFFISLFLILPLAGCRDKDDNVVTEPPEGCINLTDLETRTDYYLPFALQNDINNFHQVILNGKPVYFPPGGFIEFSDNGFYELILIKDGTGKAADTILFTTTTEERELSEWGIRAWIPAPYKTVVLGKEEVEIFYPRRYTDLIKVPFIFYVRENGEIKPVYCKGIHSFSGKNFNIKRGTGSVNLAASSIRDKMDFQIGGRRVGVSLSRITGQFTELNGIINTEVVIPENSLVRITGNLSITSTGSLTVNEGTIILIDEAIDINVSGPVLFSGLAENPVFVTCSRDDKFWGGFITKAAAGTIEAKYTIFCQSGFHDSEGYDYGHAGRQALFYTENSTLKLDHCFMVDHIGQIFYPQYARLTLNEILVQRAFTGGQVNYSDLTMHNSYFTDFPDDSYVFRDNDNDALYLSASDAEIENSTFMFAGDDGIDSGNEEGGTVIFINCRFESCFHEGAALSSGGSVVKNHSFTGCVFTNCGQGLELGFSSPGHIVNVENCMFLDNGTGIRYGDNYTWSDINGKMYIVNSFSLFNDRDVWNMIRKTWTPRLENMNFVNTQVSEFCPQYPDLEILK